MLDQALNDRRDGRLPFGDQISPFQINIVFGDSLPRGQTKRSKSTQNASTVQPPVYCHS